MKTPLSCFNVDTELTKLKLVSFDVHYSSNSTAIVFELVFGSVFIGYLWKAVKTRQKIGGSKFIIETIFLMHDILGAEKHARI